MTAWTSGGCQVSRPPRWLPNYQHRFKPGDAVEHVNYGCGVVTTVNWRMRILYMQLEGQDAEPVPCSFRLTKHADPTLGRMLEVLGE